MKNPYIIEITARKKQYLQAIEQVLDSGQYILGREVEKFEQNFSEQMSSRYCVGVANGLEALQISLMASGVGKGDDVITTPVSAFATTLAILAVGAEPIFVDIKPNGQIDETKIAAAITKKTKAIIPVHLYGIPANIVQLKKIAAAHKLLIIEDACQAHGAHSNKVPLGSIGDTGCFSFYPTKNLAALGDAGALITNNKAIYQKARVIRDYGQTKKYTHTLYGLNSRLDELQAAILNLRLEHLNQDNQARSLRAKLYYQALAPIKQLQLIEDYQQPGTVVHQFVVKTDSRDKLQAFLLKQNIPALIHYPTTIPDQPFFASKYTHLHIPIARKFVTQILSLPCHSHLPRRDIEYVVQQIKKFFAKTN